MASRQDTMRILEETRIVAVIRVDSAKDVLQIARALGQGGVRLVEITMTVPDALEVIRIASRELGDSVLVGAGTVLDPTAARLAIDAGASFLVAPIFDPEMIRLCHLFDRVSMPGALTPTEIFHAWAAGADVVKVFPGGVATPAYLKDLRGPFPEVRLMPTGNVDRITAPQYLEAGAVAVGVGKSLVDPRAVAAGDFAAISSSASEWRELVDATRAATS